MEELKVATRSHSYGFCTGAIIRVRMKHFLTYEDCEVRPGPKLNVVIGPNGTGKSALSHAICLACCGTPKDVGRSEDLTHFVMKGKEGQLCFVEVDLLGPDGNAITIRRELNSDTRSSKWHLNGKKETQAYIKKIVNKLNIDLDNLSTFMPQEKVGNFSNRTPAEVLAVTLRSLDPGLYTEQQELAAIESDREKSRRDHDAKQNLLTHRERQMESMSEELKRLQEREKAMEHLKYLRIVKIRVEGKKFREQHTACQAALDEATQRLNSEQERIDPLEAALRTLQQKQAGRDRVYREARTQQQRLDKQLRRRRDDLQSLEEEVHSAREVLMGLEQQRRRRQDDLRRLQEKLQVEETELQLAEGAIPALRALHEEKRARMRRILDQRADLEDELNNSREQSRQHSTRVSELTQELNSMKNRPQLFRAQLHRLSDPRRSQLPPSLRKRIADTSLAMDWLARHQQHLRDSGELRDVVLGPVAMHCEVKDSACADIFEKLVPINKLLGFIVKNDHDASVLRRYWRETGQGQQRLDVDVYTMKNAELDTRRPYSAELLASGPLQQYGLKYLADEIVCPDSVRSFLNTFHGLDKVLWGKSHEPLSDEAKLALCAGNLPPLLLYLYDSLKIPVNQYTGKRSAHDNRAVPTVVWKGGRRGLGFVLSVSDQLGGQDFAETRAALEGRIAEARQLQAEASAHVQQQTERMRQLQDERNQVNQELKEVTKGLDLPKRIQDRVQTLQRRRALTQSQLEKSGLEQERQQLSEQYEAAIGALLVGVDAATAAAENRNEHESALSVATHLHFSLREAIAAAARDLDEAREDLQTYRQQVQHAQQQRHAAALRVQRSIDEVNAIIEESGLSKEAFGSEVYARACTYCDPEVTPLDEIERRMAVLSATIDNIAENPQLQARFQEIRAEVEHLREEVNATRAGYRQADDSLRGRLHRWLDAVKAIVDKLDGRFQDYMQSMQYQGAVRLVETGAINAYEVDICVKFRESADLMPMSGTRHSGGERAVTTLLYMLAMHSMTQAPFRIVDEINQGMDEVNERLAFDRIVHECCDASNKSQYFLITPKLLPALNSMDNDAITVLLILNGPGVDGRPWDLSEVLSHTQAPTQTQLGAPALLRAGGSSSSSSGSSGAAAGGGKVAGGGRVLTHGLGGLDRTLDEEDMIFGPEFGSQAAAAGTKAAALAGINSASRASAVETGLSDQEGRLAAHATGYSSSSSSSSSSSGSNTINGSIVKGIISSGRNSNGGSDSQQQAVPTRTPRILPGSSSFGGSSLPAGMDIAVNSAAKFIDLSAELPFPSPPGASAAATAGAASSSLPASGASAAATAGAASSSLPASGASTVRKRSFGSAGLYTSGSVGGSDGRGVIIDLTGEQDPNDRNSNGSSSSSTSSRKVQPLMALDSLPSVKKERLCNGGVVLRKFSPGMVVDLTGD